MPKRVHIDLLPKTPGGRHLKRDEIFAEEIEVDNDITIKAHLLRECVPGNPWFESEGDLREEEEVEEPPPKYMVRKSVDLRRIRSLKDRVEAIRASPMVDARPRRSRSQSFSEGATSRNSDDDALTPLRLPSRSDLLHSTSRRLSRMIMNQRSCLLSPGAQPAAEPDPLSAPITSPNLTSALEPLQLPVNSELSVMGPQTPLMRRKSISVSPTTSPITGQAAPVKDLTTTLATSDAQSADAKPKSTTVEDPSSAADFRLLAELEQARLNILCDVWSSVMSEEAGKIPEQALDAIRATVGKCQLVLQKKMPFFLSLVDLAESGAPEESKENQPPSATVNDLAGYWALVANEITRADEAFERLAVWRDEGQWEAEKRPVTPARHGPADKQTRPNRSKIPTKQILPTRKVDLSELPSGTPKALAQALKKSAKKSKTAARSKFVEFLKSKKTAMKSERVLPASPLVMFGSTALPQTKSNLTSEITAEVQSTSTTTDAIMTSTTTGSNASTTSLETKTPQTPSVGTSAIKQDDSFAVPKHRVPASGTRHVGRSAVKRAAPPPPPHTSDTPSSSSARLDTSTEGRPSVSSSSNSSQLHVASTPITSVRTADNWHLESTLKTPTSGLRRLQLSGKSSSSLSAIRPGTPRPPMKPKSARKRNSSSIGKPAFRSDRSLATTTESPFYTPPLGEPPMESPAMPPTTDKSDSRPRTTREHKRISFAPELSHTPGGHRFGSGSPRASYPLTPANTSGSLFAADRVLRRRRNMVDALTPLGLRPVSRRSRGTPKPQLT